MVLQLLLLFLLLFSSIFSQSDKQNLEDEKEKLKIERQKLEEEKQKFKKEKDDFEIKKKDFELDHAEEIETDKKANESEDNREENFFKLEDSITITASRKEQRASQAPSKVIVYTKDQIYKRGYRNLTELFQDIPGISMNTFQDSGEANTRFAVRGLFSPGQSQMLIMENGIVLNDISQSWMRHIGYDYSLLNVERVEIILGPGSAMYGTNAYAGLVNIITKKPTDLFKYGQTGSSTEVRTLGGMYNTKSIEGQFAHKFSNDLVLQFSGRSYSSDGDHGLKRADPANMFHNNYEPDKVTTTEYGNVTNDRYPGNARKPLPNGFNTSVKDYFVRGSMHYKGFTAGFQLWDQLEGLGSYVPGYEYFTNTSGIEFQKHHRGNYVYANHDFNFSKNFSVTTKIYYRNTSIQPDTGFVYTYRYQSVDNPLLANRYVNGVPNKAKEYRNQSFLTGMQQQFNYKISRTNDLVFGTFYERVEKADSDSTGISLGYRQKLNSNITESSWDDINNKHGATTVQKIYYSYNIAGYIQDEQKFFNNKYSLTGGVRLDYDRNYGRILSPRSGIVGNPITNFNFKLLYGEAFQAPTASQLYQEFTGNAYLRPQRIKTSEIEVSYAFTQNFSLKGGYFFSRLQDVIVNAPNPNDGKYLVGPNSEHASYYQNKSANHLYGYLLEADWKFLNDLNLFFNYSYIRDRRSKQLFTPQTNSQGYITKLTYLNDGTELDNIPLYTINAGINYLFLEKYNFNLRMNHTGKVKMPTTNAYYQPYDFDFEKSNYPYMNAGYKANGYMSGYTVYHLTVTIFKLLGIENLEPQLIIRNLLNKSYLTPGQVNGNAVRPVDSVQPTIQNPVGLNPPYHAQPGREIYLQLSYRF